ncbi:MAG TPA: hypothetical protein VE616_01650 [Candidatus Udaeobacter sp.]|nr:hypothetical protein [Candidatus Udaeobacter sp.]
MPSEPASDYRAYVEGLGRYRYVLYAYCATPDDVRLFLERSPRFSARVMHSRIALATAALLL